MSRLAVALVALAAGSSVFAAEPKAPETNIVFRNATIHDGSGKPAVKGDVHVKGDKIEAVGTVGKINGATEIDQPASCSAPASSTCTPTATPA
jgi:N-acyl-D-amino-acid deacylase